MCVRWRAFGDGRADALPVADAAARVLVGVADAGLTHAQQAVVTLWLLTCTMRRARVGPRFPRALVKLDLV